MTLLENLVDKNKQIVNNYYDIMRQNSTLANQPDTSKSALRTGYFLQNDEGIMLVDMRGNSYPINVVYFTSHRLNAYEGDIELPRPFIVNGDLEILTEEEVIGTPAEDPDRDGVIEARGDMLLLGCLEGDWKFPIVLDVISKLSVLDTQETHSFFEGFDRDTRDNAYKRRETKSYSAEMKRERSGRVRYTHTQKKDADGDLDVIYEFINQEGKSVSISITGDTVRIMDARNKTLFRTEYMELGRDDKSTEPMVLGNAWFEYQKALLQLLATHSHAPGSPAAQAPQFSQKISELKKMLSSMFFIDEASQQTGGSQ